MKKIRNNIFETNSSSTNCLVFGENRDEYYIPEKISIIPLYGGRDFCYSDIDSKFTILASCCLEISEFLYLCYKMYEFGVKEIILPKPETFTAYNDRIDIGNWEISVENRNEIANVLKDDILLKNWLFNPESEISGEDDNYL